MLPDSTKINDFVFFVATDAESDEESDPKYVRPSPVTMTRTKRRNICQSITPLTPDC